MENIAQQFKENNTKRNELLQQMLVEPKVQSELELFFSSMCKTVEKFAPLDQVRIKMQISQMVSQTELAQLEQLNRVPAQTPFYNNQYGNSGQTTFLNNQSYATHDPAYGPTYTQL